MGQLPPSVLLGLGQLFDGAVLRILIKSIALTIAVFVIVAVAAWFAWSYTLTWLGMDDEIFTGARGLRGIASAMLALLGLWLIWRIVAMGVVQFYAEDVVRAVEARHYSQEMQAARDLPFVEQLQQALGASGRALLFNILAAPFALAVLFTGIGPAVVFWVVNALLLGREFQDMVWLRHRGDKADTPPIGKATRFTLGAAIAGLLTVPFANFLAPVLGATTATHLIHRSERARHA